MAAAEPAPRRIYQQRSRLTSLPLYYEGFLWIKQGRSKEVKYWTELRGTKLFLYGDKKQEKFTGSIDLQYLSSATDKYSNQKQWTEVILQLPNEEVYIKTETAEDAEEWKGFILTVSQLSVPTSLTLLPGQIIQLKEVLEKESSRRASESFEEPVPVPDNLSPVFSSTYEDVEKTNAMPTCFYSVTRQQATEMLMNDEDSGSLILRPGADCKNYAVTIREPTENSSRPQVKHYKVVKTDRGFTIELDRPVVLSSLHEVVDHFVAETRGKLRPYNSSIYDTQIDYIVKEAEKKANNDTEKKTQSKIKLLVNQFSQERSIPIRGMENAYVNVFPR
ncbi:signal-transducing adaptor protein 1-like isoform X3 [Hyla sarda]|nr:signal-transducing adaptor protein 1-like isoform X3 [Hyla sarda]XP_056424865.1 signal-transducing adaptor protein 1-like isoform X3 [Hyla sarda]XP_056424866.1 signal-transducing adaptor protein 1-like isoform X3 [Hyla sarda]